MVCTSKMRLLRPIEILSFTLSCDCTWKTRFAYIPIAFWAILATLDSKLSSQSNRFTFFSVCNFSFKMQNKFSDVDWARDLMFIFLFFALTSSVFQMQISVKVFAQLTATAVKYYQQTKKSYACFGCAAFAERIFKRLNANACRLIPYSWGNINAGDMKRFWNPMTF